MDKYVQEAFDAMMADPKLRQQFSRLDICDAKSICDLTKKAGYTLSCEEVIKAFKELAGNNPE